METNETNEFKNFKKYVIDNLNRLDPNSEEFKLKEFEVFNQLNEISPDKNGKYFYALARDVKGANIKKCEDVIIKNILNKKNNENNANSIYNLYKLAKDVEGVDISRCLDILIKKNNANYIYKLAKNVKGINIRKCEDGIISIIDATSKYSDNYAYDMYFNKKNYEILADFAGNIEGADIERIKNIIPSHQHDKYGLEKNIEKVKINEFSNIFKYKFEN